MEILEAKCTNEFCSAFGVWILDADEDGFCNTCGEDLSDAQVAPPQKFANPADVPDAELIEKGP